MTRDRDIPILTRRQFVVGTAALAGASALGLLAGEPLWIEFDTMPGAAGAHPTPARAPADSLPTTRGGAWLALEPDNTVVAFVPNCTHQLCFYDWETASAGFRCRCHEAFFSVDGAVISSPPPRPLWRYETRPAGPDTVEIGWLDKA